MGEGNVCNYAYLSGPRVSFLAKCNHLLTIDIFIY